MPADLAKIAGNLVKNVASGELCRLGARELSSLKPQLDAHDVRLIGVGLEELGVEEFVKDKYFDGELYIDTKKQCYKDMGYRRMNFFNMFPSVFKSRSTMNKAKKEHVSGNLSGDGMQNGGVLVISKGGDKVLLDFRQENPGDHVALEDVLKALGIEGKPVAPADGASGGKPKMKVVQSIVERLEPSNAQYSGGGW